MIKWLFYLLYALILHILILIKLLFSSVLNLNFYPFMSNQINLQVNGETHHCVSPIALPELLQQLGLICA